MFALFFIVSSVTIYLAKKYNIHSSWNLIKFYWLKTIERIDLIYSDDIFNTI
jgi:hypothetical protein